MSTSTPAAKPTLLDKIRTKVVLVLGAAVTIGEGVLQAVPAGTVTAVLQIALPAVAFLVAHIKTVSLAGVDAAVAKLRKL